MKDGTRHTYSVPDGDPQEIFNQIIEAPDINKQDIKTNYFFPETLYGVYDFQNHFDEETKDIDEKPLAIQFKIEEIRNQRSSLFKVLDLEFMKSLEEGNKVYIDHIVKIKNYLRNMPGEVEDYCEELGLKEIIQFNAFNNIYDVDIIHKGSGYNKPPTVTISPPNGENMYGFHIEAVATVKDGSLSDITVTRTGSGYTSSPAVGISPPDEEGGEPAIAAASPPENDIYTIKLMIDKLEREKLKE